ncbi:spermidine dehydrogenase [Nonomuraea thailandensis]|uniref:Spermidine dehydrogenase n=1 Tax=Nonomuraea thailandensis TaxID=1188745 RepID=A0A9X2GXZ0_9ACTN|nr:FAD-dependent oxidoreductase [Nonomuraea thailandensis]MCP2362988.1 spermidine dehydrogenase [Nonomuraea thailandensis]
MSFSPRALGMDVPITRRDFFDGIAVSCVAGSAAPKAPNPPHPFTVSGDTSEALSVAHALRDGRFWAHAGPPVPTGEHHDLVVVGGGRGGRSAAAEWLRRHPRAGVLVLDTHEALGDHAALGDNAAPDDHAALGDRELLAGRAAFDAVMCDAETFGADTLVATDSPGWIDRLPIAWQARRDLRALHEDPPDWFPGVPAEGKQERLAGLTYAEFLREVCGAHPDAERFCRTMSCPDWGYDTRAFGAIDAWGTGYPGFAGLGLSREQPSRYNSPTVRRHWHGPAPAAAVPALDGRVRVRTSSPVVSVRDGARSATVGYFDGHQVCTVEAGAVILACWSAVVPYLVPELPPERRGALRQASRVPLLEATVRLRDPVAWRRLGVERVRWTGAYWCASEFTPPDTVRMLATPCRSELGPCAGSAAGRRELIRTPYSTLEHTVRDQLARLLGPAGFDPGGGIAEITVRRWGHALAPEYCRPWHAFYPDGPFPADAARGRFGRIAIAGSDAEPAARGEAAVAAALRAVGELTR